MDNTHIELKTGTGAAITIKPGFKPSYIKVINIEGLCTLEHTPGKMDAGKGWKQITAGTGSYISTGGITMNDDGLSFSIGTDADINVSGEDLVVICLR